MYLKLSFINLRAKPIRTALTTTAVIISITFLTFFNSFENGLKNYLLKNSLAANPLTQLSVKPQGQGNMGLNPMKLLSSQTLNSQNLEQIKKIPHVLSVEPQSTIKGISSLQVSILGQWFQTDSLIFGSPYETIASKDLTADQWQAPEKFDFDHPVPALVSSKLIDLYNYSFASSNGLPQINPQNFVGNEIYIMLNESVFFNNQNSEELPKIKAKIVGFSPKVKLLGITLPEKAVEQINQQYLNSPQKNYPDAIVRVDSVSNIDSVKQALLQINLKASSGVDELDAINHYFTVFGLALNLINVIILAICGLMIAYTFLTKVSERTKDIGIMRAIGASAHQIQILFLTEALSLIHISSPRD